MNTQATARHEKGASPPQSSTTRAKNADHHAVRAKDDNLLRIGGVRALLRERTAAEHEATEACFARFNLSDPDHYRRFLTAHAMALPALEIAVTGRGWSAWQPRFPQLADDVAALDGFLPVPIIAPDISDAGAWGAQYVLEGSRLGGRILASRLPDGAPSRYLSPPDGAGMLWREFCDRLEAEGAHRDGVWLNDVVEAAIETFQRFRRAAVALAEEI